MCVLNLISNTLNLIGIIFFVGDDNILEIRGIIRFEIVIESYNIIIW